METIHGEWSLLNDTIISFYSTNWSEMLLHWPQRLSWMPETFHFAPQCLFLHIHTDGPACTEAKLGFLKHLRDKPGWFTPMYRHNPVFSSSAFFRLQLGGHHLSVVYLWQIRPDHPGLPPPHQAPNTDHEPGRHFHLSGTRMQFFNRQTVMRPPLHQTTGQKKGKGHVEYRMRPSEGLVVEEGR